MGGEGGRDGGRAAQPPLAVEEGALLLVRLYQNAEQLIAQYLHDELSSVDRVRAELDALASRLRARLLAKQKGDLGTAVDGSSPSSSPNEDEDADAGEAVRELKALLFVEEGLRGADSADYYNFENSLLDCVLSARRGIPISLSCIFAAVCHRVGVSLDMIGLPGHFLLATRPHDARSRRPQPEQRGAEGAVRQQAVEQPVPPPEPAERIFVDAFHGGELLRLRQCEAIVRSYGYAWSEEMAMPVQPIEVCTRMLRNLLNAHKQSGDARAARVIDCVLASSSRSSAPLLPNPLPDAEGGGRHGGGRSLWPPVPQHGPLRHVVTAAAAAPADAHAADASSAGGRRGGRRGRSSDPLGSREQSRRGGRRGRALIHSALERAVTSIRDERRR